MKLLPLIAVPCLLSLFLQNESPEPTPAPAQQAFALAEIVEGMRESGRGWSSFLERADLSCGVYRLAAGATDGQGPHAFDEVYYIVEGKAVLDAGEESFPCETGSILYVKKNVTHRFRDIEEDLTVLVFFAKGGPRAAASESGSEDDD